MIRSAFREKRMYQLHCPDVAEFRKVLEKIRPRWEEAVFWVGETDLLYEPETDNIIVIRTKIPVSKYCYSVDDFFNEQFKVCRMGTTFEINPKNSEKEPTSGPCLAISDLEIDDGWCRLIGVRKLPNYEAMIFNLEKNGLVKTTPTTGYMAFSAYKFCFADEEVFYDVDCLGTTLCSDITEKVKTLHLENFGC